MKKIKPGSTVDAPFLSEEEALRMPEFAEGLQARNDGKNIAENPYAIFKVSPTAEGLTLTSKEWRLQFENKFSAWMFGYNHKQ